jgi:hypothetical protein
MVVSVHPPAQNALSATAPACPYPYLLPAQPPLTYLYYHMCGGGEREQRACNGPFLTPLQPPYSRAGEEENGNLREGFFKRLCSARPGRV